MEEGNGEILLYTTTSSSTSIVARYFVQACKSITFYNHNLGVKNTTSPTSSIVPSHFGKTGVCFEQKLQNSIWRTLLRTSNISSLFGEALLVFLY